MPHATFYGPQRILRLHCEPGPAALGKAIPPGARWITVHPNGPDAPGVPVLIQETQSGSGTYHVIGGAGGKLNYLKLHGVKPEGDHRAAALERRKARERVHKDQVKREKDAGTYQAKQDARKQIKLAAKAAEHEFVRTVADKMGWDPKELEPPTTDGASKEAAARIAREHQAALLKRYAGDQEVSPAEIHEAVRQYREVEARYRGTDQWLKAPNGRPSKLNARQWVLVRTPNFKRWFGDWELSGQRLRSASNFEQARQSATAFQGRDLRNQMSGLVGVVSRNNLDKMLSASAVRKSESPTEHAMAVANLDRLFRDAVLGWSKTDRDADPNVASIHRLFAPMRVGDEARLVKITLKETVLPGQRNSVYSVEAIRVGKASPVPEMVDADRAQGSRLLTGPTRLTESLVQRVAAFNVNAVSKVVDANGEPQVVYHATTRAGFSIFHANSHFGTRSSASQRQETQADLRERRAAGHRQRIERGGEAADRARKALDRLEAGESLEVGAADALAERWSPAATDAAGYGDRLNAQGDGGTPCEGRRSRGLKVNLRGGKALWSQTG